MLNESELHQLFQYARSFCSQRADALDLVQGGIEVYLQKVTANKKVENKMAFVRKIIRNRFIDLYRREQRFEHESYQELSVYDMSVSTLEGIMISRSELEAVWVQLNEFDRDILFHWAVLGYSTKEIAELLAMPLGSILSRIHRLRQQFASDKSKPPVNKEQGA